GIAVVAVLHHLGGAFEPRHLAHAGDVAAVPLHTELEVLVRVEAGGVDAELCHRGLLLVAGFAAAQVWIWPASCWIWMITNSAGLGGAEPTRMVTTAGVRRAVRLALVSPVPRCASRAVVPWSARS